ncbi:hypothetical protein, variant 2 [Phialophora macrospora]|uniref:DUF2293 domain-containing protein n=1 Tax=Phialophora macrospora TaxID=1851006 RepID=A0A0D2E0F2_9EURO|nr:hypothetical protein, variant 1 [Phialophora macrospora]KIW67843.1 hypothetical protein, variant 2 [Phialophora macrospora]
MAKVKQKVARQGAAGASTRGAQVAKQKKHRIAVQGDPKDKKLPTVVAFTENPPPGYTFIAAGNPELTNALKEFASRGQHKIFVVTITPHAKRHELSRQIHRVGYHFPTTVVDQVCAHYGIRLNNRGELIDESKDEDLFRRVYQNADGQRPAEKKDQITINTEAKQTIKDLFPKIPDSDLFRIIKHAFQLSDARVGTAPELSLLRRAHLAVVAHIRHNYTSYDKLLRHVQYNEARHQVEKETLEKIIEWRGGEDMALEDTGNAADDLLKDVIVISDEDASEGEADDVQPLLQEQVRVEELPSATHGRGYDHSPSPVIDAQSEHYRPYPRLVHSYKPSDAEIAQRNQTRYAVWDQARRDYHSRIAQPPTPAVERVYHAEPAQASRILIPLDEPTHRPAQLFRHEVPVQRPMRIEYEPLPPPRPNPPQFIRDANGNLFERVDSQPRTAPAETSQRYYQHEPPAMSGALVRARPSSPPVNPQPQARYPANREGGDGLILPSVEEPEGSYAQSRPRRNPFDREGEPRDTNTMRQEVQQLRDGTLIDLNNSSSQTPKRRRLEDIAPSSGDRMVRRESPGRQVESQYLPQRLARTAQPESRIVDYGEPRYDSHLQASSSVREHTYAGRQLSYNVREPPRTYTRVYEPLPETQEALDPARAQYRPQDYGVVRHEVESIRPVGHPRYGHSTHVGPSYEPIMESRKYDGRMTTEHVMPAREQYIHPSMQETRVRYIYADGTEAREPLQAVAQQREHEYERPNAPVRSYVR